MMKKHIVIVEIVSTGFNYVEDALMRGYQPVVVECTYPGTEEDRPHSLYLVKLPEANCRKVFHILKKQVIMQPCWNRCVLMTLS